MSVSLVTLVHPVPHHLPSLFMAFLPHLPSSLALLLWRLRKIRGVCFFWGRSCSPDAQKRRVILGFPSCIFNRQRTVACPDFIRRSETVGKGRLVVTGRNPL